MSEDNYSNSVIRDLLDRVSELSQIISPQSTDTINSEVRSVSTTRRQICKTHSRHKRILSLQRLFQINNDKQQVLLSYHNKDRALRLKVVFQFVEILHFKLGVTFPLQDLSQITAEGEIEQQTPDNRPFLRDVILLSSPEDEVVPRQGACLLLMENGHIISGVRFSKDLSAAAIETCIIQAFDGKIPSDVDIEIMTSVHSSLVAPTLVPGQLLDGVMIHRIFRQKPLYIRRSRRLLETGDVRQVF